MKTYLPAFKIEMTKNSVLKRVFLVGLGATSYGMLATL
jgi:hypothetical protein